jgi:hypothetical protein
MVLEEVEKANDGRTISLEDKKKRWDEQWMKNEALHNIGSRKVIYSMHGI